MAEITPIEYGKTYHIYNRGVDSCALFTEAENYRYFLRLYHKYIPLIADTFAWVLMKNHFHFLLRIKNESEILPFPALQPPSRSSTIDGVACTPRKPIPSHQFSHLFNSYAQSFNKSKNRTGPLFESPFHRKVVESKDYFKRLVVYINTNPSHHHIKEQFVEYPWSSYNEILYMHQENSAYHEVIDLFDQASNYVICHSHKNISEPLEGIDLEP